LQHVLNLPDLRRDACFESCTPLVNMHQWRVVKCCSASR